MRTCVRMAHAVEIWEMQAPDGRSTLIPTCLNCGWVGEATTKRGRAVDEGAMHERGTGHPRQGGPTIEVERRSPGGPTARGRGVHESRPG